MALVHLAELPPEADIAALQAEVAAGRNPKDAKVALAREITARFHPLRRPTAEAGFQPARPGWRADEVPSSCSCRWARAARWVGIGAAAPGRALVGSGGEGNWLIDGGGVRVGSTVVSDKGLKLGAGTYVLQVGKRKFVRVTLA